MEQEQKNAAAESTQQKTAQEQTTQTPETAYAVKATAVEGGGAAGEGDEGAEVAAAEQKPRDLFYERIRTNMPDGRYDEDEEEYFRSAGSYLDKLEGTKKSYDDLMAKFEARLGSDPQESEVMLDWLDGIDIRTAVARHMGEEALHVPEEGSEEYESFKKAGDERRKELADMKAKVDEYRASAEQSEADLKAFAEEAGLDEAQTAELEKYIAEDLLPRIYAGKLDKDFYKSVMRSRNYDADIEGAREQGRIDGRNEKIEVEKKRHAGSGLPNAGVGGNVGEEAETPKQENKTVDWLDRQIKRR